jgi:hypothetical protein
MHKASGFQIKKLRLEDKTCELFFPRVPRLVAACLFGSFSHLPSASRASTRSSGPTHTSHISLVGALRSSMPLALPPAPGAPLAGSPTEPPLLPRSACRGFAGAAPCTDGK